ncbi:MAG: D-glycero-beta-D-manno-heptose-7-phosphate kinase [Rhodospirillaceae bacterium]|nr:D-glycero-beta-D-manno-heptose-7-phosphate kinase [Rhodospirillaceae bacterium]
MTIAVHPAADDTTALAAVLAGFRSRHILCVGDAMVDRFVYGDVKRISPEAPVPVVRIEREAAELGGAGNVVRNIVALGSGCSFVSVIGSDRAGSEISELLGRLPHVKPYLRVSRERETTVKTRFFSKDGHHLLRADREITAPLSAKDAAELGAMAVAQVGDADAVILSDYGKGVFAQDLAARIIAAARKAGKPVIVDPKGVDYSRYVGATVIAPNRAELAEATGMPVDDDAGVIAAARSLCVCTTSDAILVTRSGEGMTLVASNGAVYHLPAETREVADVTGAGDTAVATLTLALACGAALPAAAKLANIAAGIVVGRHATAVATAQDLSSALLHTGLAGAEQKVGDRDTALTRAAEWRAQGLKIGFTNGCFDLLHPGHVSLLRQARAACDRLVVGLNSDASVRRLKGDGRPVQSETARAAVMASLANVDLVVIFSEDTPLALIQALRPDVLVKGADYQRPDVVGGDFVEAYGGSVVLAELIAPYSTTATIAALKTTRSSNKP